MRSDDVAVVAVFALGVVAVGIGCYFMVKEDNAAKAECEGRNGLYVCHTDSVWIGGKAGIAESCRCEPKVYR